MTHLAFPDSLGYADLVSFVARARRANAGGAVRLQARGSVLGVYTEVLAGPSLFAEGAVVGVRGMTLAEPADIDVVVASAALAERFARDPTGPILSVPPATVQVSWAGALPGLGDRWELAGQLPAQALDEAAAAAAAKGMGGQAWGAPTSTDPVVSAGAAFACRVLGFLVAGEVVQVYRLGRWSRVRTERGHVLAC